MCIRDSLTGPIEVGLDFLGGPSGLPGIEQPFVQTALDFYEDLLLAGHHVAPVSGSDEKQVAGHGSSVTAVYAEELSRAAVFEALDAATTYVRTRGVDGSPTIDVTATSGDQEVGLGGTLVGDTGNMTIEVTGGQGQLAEVTRNGQPYLSLPVTGDPATLTVPLQRSPDEGPLGTFHRVDLREPSGIRSVLSSAVFLADALPGETTPDGTATPKPATTEAPAAPAADPDAPDEDGALAATGGGAALGAAVALLLAAALRRR